MNMLAEHFIIRKLQKKWRQKTKGTNIHHRQAVKNGGTGQSGNLVRVPKKSHAAYHAFLGTKTVLQIIRYLNHFWLPLRVVAIPIPTNRLSEVMIELVRLGVFESTDVRQYGVTAEHLRFHGAPEEQRVYTKLHYDENMRRPE